MSLEAETLERPLPQLPAGSDWTAVAEAGVVALPAEDRTQILSTWATIEETLLSLPPLICLVGGLFLVPFVLGDKAKLPYDRMLEGLTMRETWGVIAGLAMILYGGYTAFFRLGGFASRVLRLRARAVVRRRRDRIVDPDDREARFVEVVPRANWYRKMPEDATDVGFLKVDAARGAVLFEGGIERWAILGDDIELCATTEIGIPAAMAVRPLVVLDRRGVPRRGSEPVLGGHTLQRGIYRKTRPWLYVHQIDGSVADITFDSGLKPSYPLIGQASVREGAQSVCSWNLRYRRGSRSGTPRSAAWSEALPSFRRPRFFPAVGAGSRPRRSGTRSIACAGRAVTSVGHLTPDLGFCRILQVTSARSPT